MNFGAILSALVPYLLQLLQDPAFQAIVKAIHDDLQKKLAGGAPPATATQQATGQLGAAAMLHLTGNPIADVQAFLASKGAKFP